MANKFEISYLHVLMLLSIQFDEGNLEKPPFDSKVMHN